jgi:hypothetical protein
MPGRFIAEQIAAQNLEYAEYIKTRDSYEVLRKEYVTAITPSSSDVDLITTFLNTWYPEGQKETTSTSIPVRPTRPNDPYQYNGYRLKQTADSVKPTEQEVQIVQEGGGGQITTGLLTPSGGGKSFGVFG